MKLLDKNKQKKLISLISLSFLSLFFVFSFATANAAGLVPCGIEKDNPDTPNINEAYDGRCTLCHLIIGIKGIMDWGKNILVITALAVITIGGVVYIISAGNDQMMETAKNIITQAIWGLAIVLGAWLIVNTGMWLLGTKGDLGIDVKSWKEFDCIGEYAPDVEPKCGTEKGSCAAGVSTGLYEMMPGKWKWTCEASKGRSETCYWPTAGPGPSPMPEPEPTPIPPGSTEAEVREILKNAGITINQGPCAPGQTTGCTNVSGLRPETINGAIALKMACPNCEVVITGGSEGGHATGQFSHANGYKVDIRPSASLDNYIAGNYTSVPSAFGGYPSYRDRSGNLYVKEGNHWDVCYGCP